MALIHKATLTPSKPDLLTTYLRSVPELSAHATDELSQVGAYRFDDPAGQVGIESHILTTASGALLQIPVVYRNEALAGAEAWLVGTMQHSVLGERWVYDACIDSVYVGQLANTMLTGGSEVDEVFETPDGPVHREPSVHVRGSGSGTPSEGPPADVRADRRGDETHIHAASTGMSIRVRHVLSDAPPPADSPASLSGTWASQPEPIILATLSAQ